MIRRARYGMLVVLALACLGGGCRVQLERPDTVPIRMIEPQLVEPGGVAADAPNATSVRLLETQGRAHIGRRVLHQQPGGEVTEDPVWLWATTPDRYLDSAVRYAIASSPDIGLVDIGSAPSLAAHAGGLADRGGAEPTAGRGCRGPGDDHRPGGPLGDHPRGRTDRGRPARRPGRGRRPAAGTPRHGLPLAGHAKGVMKANGPEVIDFRPA